MKVLLTGANGFIGSHVGSQMNQLGWEIMATHRTDSNLSNSSSFASAATWINIDNSEWKRGVIEFCPDVIVHCAWIGVSVRSRDDINTQLLNLKLIGELLEIAKICKIKKIVGLGSQAEYGEIDQVVDENYPVKPNSAYGMAKLASYEIIKHYCSNHNIKWYWLRLFSFFGENEPESWLIPSIVGKALKGSAIDTTLGEQQYAYLYVKDLAVAICKLVDSDIDPGLFVISAHSTIKIKDLIGKIRDMVNPECEVNFGAIPYRVNQSMLIKGDSAKFEKLFGKIERSDFDLQLMKVVNHIVMTKSSCCEGI